MTYITLKGNEFGNMIDLLSSLLDDCAIVFTQTGITVKTIDSSMVCLINVNLKDVYVKSNIEDDVEISVKLADLNKILSCKSKNDLCTIKFNQDDIQLIYTNENNKRGDKYRLKLLDLDSSDPGDLEVESTNEIVLSSAYFSTLCKKIKKFDESLVIVMEESTSDVMIQTGSDDMVELVLEKGEDVMQSVKIQEDIKVRVLLKYLLLFCKAEKFTDDLTITIDDEESPLEISYEFGESFIKFYIAPQIDGEY